MRWQLVAIGCVAIVLLCGSCRRLGSPSVRVDSELVPYVPVDTTMLAGVDMEGLRRTSLYGRHAHDLDAALRGLQGQAGVDASRELLSALIAFPKGRPLVLLHGTFKTADLAAHLERSGAQRNGEMLLTGSDAVSLPREGIAIAGPSDSVRDVAGAHSKELPAALIESIRPLPSSDQIWIASDKGLPLGELPLRPDLKSAATSLAAYVSNFDAGISVDGGAQIHIDLHCDSAENAGQVNAVLRAGLGLARYSARDNEPILHKVYDSVRISYEQQTVHVRADLSSDLADELVGFVGRMRQ